MTNLSVLTFLSLTLLLDSLGLSRSLSSSVSLSLSLSLCHSVASSIKLTLLGCKLLEKENFFGVPESITYFALLCFTLFVVE